MPNCPKCGILLTETHVLLEAMRYDQLHRTRGTDGIRYFCPKCKAEYCTEDFMTRKEMLEEASRDAKDEIVFLHRDEFNKIKNEILEQRFGIKKETGTEKLSDELNKLSDEINKLFDEGIE